RHTPPHENPPPDSPQDIRVPPIPESLSPPPARTAAVSLRRRCHSQTRIPCRAPLAQCESCSRRTAHVLPSAFCAAHAPAPSRAPSRDTEPSAPSASPPYGTAASAAKPRSLYASAPHLPQETRSFADRDKTSASDPLP